MHDTAGSIEHVASFGPGNSRAHRGTVRALCVLVLVRRIVDSRGNRGLCGGKYSEMALMEKRVGTDLEVSRSIRTESKGANYSKQSAKFRNKHSPVCFANLSFIPRPADRPTSEQTSSSSRKPGPTILKPTHPRKAQIQPSGKPTFKRPYLLTHLGRGDSDAATTEKEMPNTILVARGDRANSPSALTISPARVTEEGNF